MLHFWFSTGFQWIQVKLSFAWPRSRSNRTKDDREGSSRGNLGGFTELPSCCLLDANFGKSLRGKSGELFNSDLQTISTSHWLFQPLNCCARWSSSGKRFLQIKPMGLMLHTVRQNYHKNTTNLCPKEGFIGNGNIREFNLCQRIWCGNGEAHPISVTVIMVLIFARLCFMHLHLKSLDLPQKFLDLWISIKVFSLVQNFADLFN